MARTEPRDLAGSAAPQQPHAPAAPGSGLYTFAESVTVTYAPPGGTAHTLSFREGVPYRLHAHLAAYLAANGITPANSQGELRDTQA